MGVTAEIRGGVARIVVDHPPLNILTRALLGELREALSGFAEADLRVLLLTATGEHFSAGADVGEHLPPEHEELIPEFLESVSALHAFPVPVIAAVQGRCLGGGFELVQAADMIVAAENATFGQPEIRLAVFPPAACALLPRLMASGAAAELLFTGDPIDARGAERAGLVQRIVPEPELEATALELASRIARHSPAALRVTKRALRESAGTRGVVAALDRAGRLYMDELMATDDALEGLRSFLEKREPVWSGR